MPQIQLPVFPPGSTAITSELAFEQRDGIVYYFNGQLPVFSHPLDDIASFRFFTSQLIANGNASQSRISRAFGVPLVTVKRACKKPSHRGERRIFPPRPTPPRIQTHRRMDRHRPSHARRRSRNSCHRSGTRRIA